LFISCSPRIRNDFSCDQLIYIFVNPTSGGNEASTFMRTGVDYYHFGGPSHVSHFYVSHIREGDSGDKPGFKRLSEDSVSNACVSTDSTVRVIEAGGDGTVVWAMQEA
jgi:diacylglycerol kinase (ATP)